MEHDVFGSEKQSASISALNSEFISGEFEDLGGRGSSTNSKNIASNSDLPAREQGPKDGKNNTSADNGQGSGIVGSMLACVGKSSSGSNSRDKQSIAPADRARQQPYGTVSGKVLSDVENAALSMMAGTSDVEQQLASQSLDHEKKHHTAHWEGMGRNEQDHEAQHLLLVVHGVGEQDGSGGLKSLHSTIQTLQSNIAAAGRAKYRSLAPVIAVRGVEWHSKLHYRDGWAKEMEEVTLDSVRRVRQMLHATIGDCFLFMSSRWHDVIVGEVITQLNKLYADFRTENPHFSGGVSIFAHSLGASITFDSLTTHTDGHESCDTLPRSPLDFHCDNFIMAGSPLGGYLSFIDPTIKWLRASNIYHMFHPLDPLAMRAQPWCGPHTRPLKPPKVVKSAAQLHSMQRRLSQRLEDVRSRVSAMSEEVHRSMDEKLLRVKAQRENVLSKMNNLGEELSSSMRSKLQRMKTVDISHIKWKLSTRNSDNSGQDAHTSMHHRTEEHSRLYDSDVRSDAENDSESTDFHVAKITVSATMTIVSPSNAAKEEGQIIVDTDHAQVIPKEDGMETLSEGLSSEQGASLSNEASEAANRSVETDSTSFESLSSLENSDSEGEGGDVEGINDPGCDVDYTLDYGTLDQISETLGMLRAHLCYWEHRDVALFILERIVGNAGQQKRFVRFRAGDSML